LADHTFAPGEALTAANMNSYAAHTGGAWNTWTPAITQTGSVTCTVNRGVYYRSGRHILASVILVVTGTGSANSIVSVSLPITAAGSQTNAVLGSCILTDSSAGTIVGAIPVLATSTSVQFFATSTTTAVYIGQTGSSFAAALGSGDTISFTAHYEAAAG
jgi:hypothetical protein